jgi:hypothetical protein
MSEQPPSPQFPIFDQIVKGNVCIKKSSKDKYRITFSKIGKFLLYQVWDKDSVNLNKKRIVKYVSAKQWVKAFKGYNKELELDINGKQPSFTPTTIMETENGHVYAFIIHTASLNSCSKVVFTVSTNEISLANNTSKKLVRLPEGKCNNVRFDIDIDSYNYDANRDFANFFRSCMTNCTGYDWGSYDDPKTPNVSSYDCDVNCCNKARDEAGLEWQCEGDA